MGKIEKSIGLLTNKAKDYEFRTTVVPSYFTPDTLKEIGKWLKGAKRYALQTYRDETTLDPDFPKEKYCRDTMKELKKQAEAYFEEVILRE